MEPLIFGHDFPLTRIVSGGQTGVDRAALDAAIFLEMEHGGWCPRGRRAEDGVIDPVYQLRETAEADYAVRTERNVVDSDGTLILCRGRLTGGTLLTERLARKHRRPCLVIDLGDHREESPAELDPRADQFLNWIQQQNVRVLNVAGPRESTAPGIRRAAEEFLIHALR